MAIKAFVAGATGYTGREVVRILRERGAETIAHIRPGSSVREKWTTAFEELGATVDTTAWDEDAMAKTLSREAPELVFFLIGTTKARDRESETDASYEAIDYGLFRLLLNACEKADIAPRVVYLSAMGVKASSSSAYYKARWKAEEALRDSGLPFVIARPAMITGPGRDESRPMERLGGAMADVAAGGLRLFGARRLADRLRSTTNTELATALVDIGLEPDDDAMVVEAEDLKRDS